MLQVLGSSLIAEEDKAPKVIIKNEGYHFANVSDVGSVMLTIRFGRVVDGWLGTYPQSRDHVYVAVRICGYVTGCNWVDETSDFGLPSCSFKIWPFYNALISNFDNY